MGLHDGTGDSGPGGSARSGNYMMAWGTVGLGARLRVGLHDGTGDSGPGGSARSGNYMMAWGTVGLGARLRVRTT